MSATKKCPFCAEEIQADAVKCKHCKEFVGDAKGQAAPMANQAPVSNEAKPQGAEGQPMATLKWTEDVFGWVFVAATFVGGLVGLFTGNMLWVILIALAALGALEEKMMRKRGLAWPSNWLVVVFPVYLWRRLDALHLPKRMLGVWAATFVVMLLVVAPLFGPSVKPGDLEGKWAIDADRTATMAVRKKGLGGEEAKLAMEVMKSVVEGITIGFSKERMRFTSPKMPDANSNLSYTVTAIGRNYISIKNKEGEDIQLVFHGRNVLELSGPSYQNAFVFKRQ